MYIYIYGFHGTTPTLRYSLGPRITGVLPYSMRVSADQHSSGDIGRDMGVLAKVGDRILLLAKMSFSRAKTHLYFMLCSFN